MNFLIWVVGETFTPFSLENLEMLKPCVFLKFYLKESELPCTGSLSRWRQWPDGKDASGSPYGQQGSTLLARSLLLFPDQQKETGLEVEHLGHNRRPVWEAMDSGGKFTHSTISEFLTIRCFQSLDIVCVSGGRAERSSGQRERMNKLQIRTQAPTRVTDSGQCGLQGITCSVTFCQQA